MQRLVSKLRAALPWLKPSDLPAARAWCEIEVLGRLGFTTGQGEPRRLLTEYRQLRSTQLGYARELAMTPAARKELLGVLEEPDAVADFHAYIRAAKPSS